MTYMLIYHPKVRSVDLPKINEKNKSMIKRAVEERLAIHPEIYGNPLRRTLKGYWKLKVGQYRVVFKITGNEILILGIIHRRDVYRRVSKRKE